MTTEANLRFNTPDFSVPSSERGLFALAAPKEVTELNILLNDARTDRKIVQGPAGLDAQGFAYINHRSALCNSDRWFTGQDLENTYLPEVCELICKVTGAKKAIVNNCAFRRKLVEKQIDVKSYLKKGSVLDQEFAKFPRNIALVYGKDEGGSLEPARAIHVDYTAVGLARTVRECRRDISEMAKEVLEAEDALKRGEDVKVPRYAAYSVWRPVVPVKQDPIVVCDYRTLSTGQLSKHEYRALSEQNPDGEYTMEYWSVGPPEDPKQAQWYWMPEQQPDEVLIIKFADTAAESDSDIARCCPHGSAIIPGTEKELARCSIECRVLAFW